ncbi:MAG: CoA transferase [Acidobacteriia bacterium]|nr:CoA transferase [Terriglobia bacterium]
MNPGDTAPPAVRPLEGVRVVDFTQLLPGPAATRFLADFGAEVIKIEPPAGDPARFVPPMVDGESALFAEINRGKKSVVADLKRDRDRQAVLALASSADVVMEGFRPGVMDRLGLGYAALAARNPRLIYVAITGFGQTGVDALRAGHDVNYLALAGALDLIGLPAGPLAIPGFQIADIGGALHAVMGTLLALAAREKTGRGQFVDVSMTNAVASLMLLPLAIFKATGCSPRRGDERLSGRYGCYGVYETADRRWVAVGALEPKFWAALCRELDCEEFIADQFAEGDRRKAIRSHLAAVFRTRTAAEWEERFRGKDVCVSAALTLAEASAYRNDPPLPVMSGSRPEPGARSPLLGEHTREWLGSSALKS